VLQRRNQVVTLTVGQRRLRSKQHDVRNRSSSFFLRFCFDSQRLRTVCLKRVHLAFLASLYFRRGSRCSPPGRQFLSRRSPGFPVARASWRGRGFLGSVVFVAVA